MKITLVIEQKKVLVPLTYDLKISLINSLQEMAKYAREQLESPEWEVFALEHILHLLPIGPNAFSFRNNYKAMCVYLEASQEGQKPKFFSAWLKSFWPWTEYSFGLNHRMVVKLIDNLKKRKTEAYKSRQFYRVIDIQHVLDKIEHP